MYSTKGMERDRLWIYGGWSNACGVLEVARLGVEACCERREASDLDWAEQTRQGSDMYGGCDNEGTRGAVEARSSGR